ncbi:MULTISPECIES: substrate-binding domain-containing protein [unclassified Micromonospora]|uniref:substrate-binding domain-containing protein n=1 Tax=unclassified Micromonospora TaxID=2617518 RepID=UPI003A87E35C
MVVEEGRYANPSLTSISPDKAAVARLAVRRLVDRIEGRPLRPPYDVQTRSHWRSGRAPPGTARTAAVTRTRPARGPAFVVRRRSST